MTDLVTPSLKDRTRIRVILFKTIWLMRTPFYRWFLACVSRSSQISLFCLFFNFLSILSPDKVSGEVLENFDKGCITHTPWRIRIQGGCCKKYSWVAVKQYLFYWVLIRCMFQADILVISVSNSSNFYVDPDPDPAIHIWEKWIRSRIHIWKKWIRAHRVTAKI